MNKSQLLKLITGIVINYLILGLIVFIFSVKLKVTLGDTAFIIGMIALFIGIAINVTGNPMGLSMQSSGNLNSQYVSRADLEAQKHEEPKDKITFSNISIISGVIIISSIFILITAYFL
jgi:hypothetical protein